MGIYLDIDLDYLVTPVRQKSINNIRVYKNDECSVYDINKFAEQLMKKGLLGAKERKFFTNHRKSYTYWWIKKYMDMTLVHIDAHSDLYRNRSRDLTQLSDTDMSCDDYIWYAIRDGFISRIYWVIPDGLYNLEDKELAYRFISSDMLESCSYTDNMLNINFSIKTRVGEKNIQYSICTLDNLPEFNEIDMLTTATSPEFIPQAADKYIEETLGLLGASCEDIMRIMTLHKEMPSNDD